MSAESSTASKSITAASPSEAVVPDTRAKDKVGPRWTQIVPVIVLLLAAGLFFFVRGNWNSWSGSRGTQETDDAYVRADLTPLSTRVSGTVAHVAVNDYQEVKAGDLLVQLKDEDYRAHVEQAAASVRAAEAAIENIQRQKLLQDARIAQAEAGIEA